MGLTTEKCGPAPGPTALAPAAINTSRVQQSNAAEALPDVPLVVIEPGGTWASLRELWAHRELLYFLTLRDLKVRYKQTIFGVAWVILQPGLMTLVFTTFLGILVRVPTSGLPYPLLVYSGLLPWTFFSSGILGASQSLVGNASLITKVYFPRVLIPTANIAGRLVDFTISFAVFVGVMLYYWLVLDYPFTFTLSFFALPLLVVLLAVLALGFGILVACLNVKYRDVGIALPVLVQIWMFVSPIVYPLDLVPAKWRMLYSVNPIVGLIQGFRAALFGGTMPLFPVAFAAIFSFALLVFACVVFRRTEKTFADVV